MNKNRQNRGITLIALIITIIVMLILVGVTVNVALNGGLFDAATDAVAKTQLELDAEQLLSATIGALDSNGKVDFNKLNDNLPEGFTVENGVYTSKSENKFEVEENGTVNSYKQLKSLENIVADVNADIAANPDEYTGLDDREGETHDKILSIFTENNITPPDDMDDNGAIFDGNIATVRYNVKYNGELVQVTFKIEVDETSGLMTIKSMAIRTIEGIIAEINADIAANPDDWSNLDDSEGETNAKLNETFNKYGIVVDQELEDAEVNVEGTDLTAIIDAIYNGNSIKIKVSAQMISESAMNVVSFELTE